MVDWIIFDLLYKPKNLKKFFNALEEKHKSKVSIRNNSIYVDARELKRNEWQKLEIKIKNFLIESKVPYDVTYCV